MPQDHTASTIAQARVIRDGLDPARVETPVRTATLALLLDTLIDLGSQPGTEKIREAQRDCRQYDDDRTHARGIPEGARRRARRRGGAQCLIRAASFRRRLSSRSACRMDSKPIAHSRSVE